MNYDKFVEIVMPELKQRLSPQFNGIEMRIDSALYNNNVRRQGILLSEKSGESAVHKVFIDLCKNYEDFLHGAPMATVLSSIVRHIADICAGGLPPSVYEMSYEWAKEHLLVDVCHEEVNRNQLSQMPHEVMGDLAYRYLVRLDGNRADNTAWVDYELLEQWGVTEETLRKDAWENMKKKLPPVVLPVSEAIGIISEEESGEAAVYAEEDPLFVITNDDNFHGASYIFDAQLFDNLAERFEDDLVILPSSVHELLFFRKQMEANIEKFILMVMEVNYTKVPPEQVLSNSVYVYDRKERRIKVYRANMFEFS